MFAPLGTKWKVDTLRCSPSTSVSLFLIGNEVYVYKDNDLTIEDLYQKKRLMSFFIDLGYFRGGTPTEETDQKCLQRIINVQLLMETRSSEERKVFLVSFESSWPLCL